MEHAPDTVAACRVLDNSASARDSLRMEIHDLSPVELAPLVTLRQSLHAAPELSGAETATAACIRAALAWTNPTRFVEGLGGAGMAVVYDSGAPGPRVMFRAELDALPIVEKTALPYASRREGVAHLCGHDGHMAILVGLGHWVARNRPSAGQVILLFQPSEENGAGARAVLADPRFGDLRPDWAFALHNMPGMALGSVAVGEGPASCASVGLRMQFNGREAHAAQPETGLSPVSALSGLLAGLAAYGVAPPMGPGFRLATLCHLRMGEQAFGVAPGEAEIWATLRATDDPALAQLEREVLDVARSSAQGLDFEVSRHDFFNATVNDRQAVAFVAGAVQALGVREGDFALPMRPSEDFGAFSGAMRTALFFLGAGKAHPALHNPDYDFPDALIGTGVALFVQILKDVMQD